LIVEPSKRETVSGENDFVRLLSIKQVANIQ